jgi:hypothetical protein
MLMTLSTSQRILPLKLYFYGFSLNAAKVDFMGIVDWFTRLHFLLQMTPLLIAVHLNQSGLA